MSVSLNRAWISAVPEPKALEEKTNNSGQTMPGALEFLLAFFFHKGKFKVDCCKTMQNVRLWGLGLFNPHVCFSVLFLEQFEFKMLYQKEFISKMSNYFISEVLTVKRSAFKKQSKLH